MDQNLVIMILVVVVAVLAGVLLLQRRRTDQLKSRFGPEYEREVRSAGSPHKAEAELLKRQKRVESLSIKPLQDADRQRFVELWRRVQTEFVDDPGRATGLADSLLTDVMTTRGYPVGDTEQVAADISVDHPKVVTNYRTAHAIALRHGDGKADTEDLRQAMIHYRELFAELVSDEEPVPHKAGEPR